MSAAPREKAVDMFYDSRVGLDQAFESEDRRKSNLLLEARLLREQGDEDAASLRFAEAAGSKSS